jgi:hypothetical protein
MEKILLTVLFVLSLFLTCGGCAHEGHGQRGERWDRDRRMERPGYREMDGHSSPRGQQHDER